MSTFYWIIAVAAYPLVVALIVRFVGFGASR